MRVDNSRDSIPENGTITTWAIRYAVCTQAISSELADNPPWIWTSELETIWTSIIDRKRPVTIARRQFKSRGRTFGAGPAASGAGGGAESAAGRAGAATTGSRAAAIWRVRRPRRSGRVSG